MKFHPEDDPEPPFLPTEPAAPARPRLPKLRGTTLEAIALWTMACAERADREALQGDAERVQFKRGEASAYRTVAWRLLRVLTEVRIRSGRARRRSEGEGG
jgi:hypothetical protein